MVRVWKWSVIVLVVMGSAEVWGQTEPAKVSGGDVVAQDAGARKKLEENLKEVAADRVGLGKMLAFLSDNAGAPLVVDWEGLGKVGVDQNTEVEISVKEVPLRRVLTEVLEQGSGGKATFWVEDGKVKVGAKDQTAAEKKKRAAALIARAKALAGQPRAAADLLIQARVMDGTGDEALLAQVLKDVKESGWTEAFSADGSVVLPAGFNEKERDQLTDTIKEITADGQGLAKAVYFVAHTMELNLNVDWAALEKAGVERDVPVTVLLKDVRIDAALKALLEKASAGKLGLADNDGLVAISTSQELASSPRYQCVWAYDVRGLTGSIVTASVKAAVDEKAWGNGCYAEVSGGVLFVRQTWENQRKVEAAVEKMRAGKIP